MLEDDQDCEMDDVRTIIIHRYLNRRTSSVGLLFADPCLKQSEHNPLEYLDLSIIYKAVVNDPIINRIIEVLSLQIFMQFEEEFQKRHLNKSSDLRKYLQKYLNVIQKILVQVSFASLKGYVNIFNLMYNERINDGMLMRRFLLLVGPYDELVKEVMDEIHPYVLEFLLYNIKISGHEGDPRSYQRIQQLLPLNICDVTYDFKKMELFLKFGHENFTIYYFEPSLRVGYEKYFGSTFDITFPNITKIVSMKRFYLIVMMYCAFDERESGSGDAKLSVVKKLWRALPDPFLTFQEIKYVLSMLVPLSRQEKVNLFCLKFEQEFGDCMPTPRSLRHLCRCAIRNAINQNGRLPEGVELLHIPAFMKHYLLLEG